MLACYQNVQIALDLGKFRNSPWTGCATEWPACKRTVKEQSNDAQERESEVIFKRFVFKRNWFMLAQTDGAEYQPPSIPVWDRARALRTLAVEEIAFELINGNCQGYATGRQIAINPLAQMPGKTLLHELGHVVLDHTFEAVHDSRHRTVETVQSQDHKREADELA
jgi:hypothetical protein